MQQFDLSSGNGSGNKPPLVVLADPTAENGPTHPGSNPNRRGKPNRNSRRRNIFYYISYHLYGKHKTILHHWQWKAKKEKLGFMKRSHTHWYANGYWRKKFLTFLATFFARFKTVSKIAVNIAYVNMSLIFQAYLVCLAPWFWDCCFHYDCLQNAGWQMRN